LVYKGWSLWCCSRSPKYEKWRSRKFLHL